MSILKPEIRKDYIQEKYVIIAPLRKKRPRQIEKPQISEVQDQTCVFCPEQVDKVKDLLTIGPRKNWRIKIIRNIFPAVSLDNPNAYGTQEVVIETPEHVRELDDLPEKHIMELLEVYALRTKEISKNKKIQYILIFKNNGGRAGASIIHSHSQIFATSFIPPNLIDKSQRVQAYKLSNGKCVYCDVIEKESKSPRIIYKDKNVIAFTPYASIHNYEAWIMPLKHIDNITCLNKNEKESFAKILKMILKKINALGLPYNYYFHQVINDEDQHLYMKITPRGSVWAGVEIGSGLVINPVSPEDAAEYYRK
ncbi:MAG: DUF4931 domain-containing protein [bacterium]